MKELRRIAAAVFALALLAGCAAGFQAGSQPFAGAPSFPDAAPRNLAKKSHAPTLYVLNVLHSEAIVSIYADGGKTFLRSLNLGKFKKDEVAFAVDSAGTLYASAADSPGSQTLQIFTNQGAKRSGAIHQRGAFGWITLDSSGNLYTFCAVAGGVCEYAGAKHPVVRNFHGWPPIAVDSAGDLVVNCANGEYILCVFAPGRTQSSWGVTGGIDNRLDSVTFDAAGDLYAANGYGAGGFGPGNVAVFTPGSSVPTRTITEGIADPTSLAFDAAGNLYVYNLCTEPEKYGECPTPDGSITVYAPGGSTPIRTITQGVGTDESTVYTGGSGLAIDGANTLYVVNRGNGPGDNGGIAVYPSGATSPIRIVTKQIHHPIAVAVGP
ncbi:MAG TPA: hypothetical protein VGF86_10865 [Candidatus Tumulicola sp.]